MEDESLILINKTNNFIISENLEVANSYFKRLKGLMFTKKLPEKNALKLIPCNQIHTFFMNYSIDVLYLDSDNNVIFCEENLKPGKIGARVKNALSVIELPNGKIKKSNIKIGDSVIIQNNK